MKQFARASTLIALALFLPVLVVVVALIFLWFGRERDAVESSARANASEITTIADAEVGAELAAMQVMATSTAIKQEDWSAAASRIVEVASLRPNWRNVILTDPRSGQVLYSLSGRGELPNHLSLQTSPAVGGVSRTGEHCPCIYLYAPVQTRSLKLLLTVVLDPKVFQSILTGHAPNTLVSAIVDRQGNFIARTLSFDERVGTQSSAFVRDAIATGVPEGFYRGRTLEGVENYSAYSISSLSGWSTHIAVDYSLIARPQLISLFAGLGGGLVAVGLSVALIMLSLRELSRAREAESRMAQTQKLEALGQLTGGVAHDFNNLLAAIIGGMRMLKKREMDERSRWIVDQVLEAAVRGDRLTKQLLTFSRQERLEVAPLELSVVVSGMEALIRQSVGSSITIHLKFDGAPFWVLGDLTQVELAVLNLSINARDAMPDGGSLTISVRPERARPDFVCLAVADTGVGIPKAVLARVTEPFFTTKPQGKGTGLGLAQVYGAISQSGGIFEISSEVAVGTTVRLLFKRTAKPDQQPEAVHDTGSKARGGRVLVVDDESGVRQFMAETLRSAGYEVAEADSAATAMAIVADRSIDILVTDFAMPGGNGLALAEKAKALRADLKVLMVSGYADMEALRTSSIEPQLLIKPFDEAALLKAVEQCS